MTRNRKNRVFIAIVAVMMIGAGCIFYACQKDGELKMDSQVAGWVQTDGIVGLDALGNVHYTRMSSEAVYRLLVDGGGGGWIWLEIGGVKKIFWVAPWNYDPNSPPPPPPFTQQTLNDIKNAENNNEKIRLISENNSLTYDDFISLSAVIDEALLAKVVSGEYVIPFITEIVSISETENKITFEYYIPFYDVNEEVVAERNVSIIWEKVEETDPVE